MFRKILFWFLLLIINTSLVPFGEYSDEFAPNLYDFADHGFKKSAVSAVAIIAFDENLEPVGGGSGNYFKYKRHRIVITAAHVVDSPIIAVQERGPNIEVAEVIYVDNQNDIAVLLINEKLKFTKPVWFSLDNNLEYGEPIYYTGNPGATPFFPVEGMLVEQRGRWVLTNMFAWPGSSGAVVFDDSGHIVGIVSSVMVAADNGLPPQIVSQVTKLADIRNLDLESLEDKLNNVKNSAKRGDSNK